MPDEHIKRAAAIFRKHQGILRTRDALRRGIHPRTLYRMRDEGLLKRISRGVYRLAELPDLAYPDLVTVAQRVPRAVVCLVSALSYHEITSEVAHEVQIALPRGTRTPLLDHPPVRVFRFSGPALTTGIEQVILDGTRVQLYDVEKTIVDCFRFRNTTGTAVAVEALRNSLEKRRVRLQALLRHARVLRVERVMLPYLESML